MLRLSRVGWTSSSYYEQMVSHGRVHFLFISKILFSCEKFKTEESPDELDRLGVSSTQARQLTWRPFYNWIWQCLHRQLQQYWRDIKLGPLAMVTNYTHWQAKTKTPTLLLDLSNNWIQNKNFSKNQLEGHGPLPFILSDGSINWRIH